MTETVIIKAPDILGGIPVFRGTRVPVQNLIDYLATGETIDNFLDDFPTVTREQVIHFWNTLEQLPHMKILIDECLPRKLKHTLGVHDVMTVPEAGWSGKKNGESILHSSDMFYTQGKNIVTDWRLLCWQNKIVNK